MSNNDQDGQPPFKRQRLDTDAMTSGLGEEQPPNEATEEQQPEAGCSGNVARSVAESELSQRLSNILICIVCLEVPPPGENYQCNLGHIICETCVSRLLADANLRCTEVHCPHCRTPIRWWELTKNLAVGQTISELPTSCSECKQQMETKCLDYHLRMECGKRLVQCQYRCLGCTWKGCQDASDSHETTCKSLDLNSDQILAEVHETDDKDLLAIQFLRECHRELSAHRIFYADLEMRGPQDSGVQSGLTQWKFYSPTFCSFEDTYRLRGRVLINRNNEYSISYRLILISPPRGPIRVKHFVILPNSVKTPTVTAVMKHFNEDLFTQGRQRGDFKEVLMLCPKDTYLLLAVPCLKLRIWMFLH